MNRKHARRYPAWLERAWLDLSREQLNIPSDREVLDNLQKDVAALSNIFTTGRTDGFHDYGSDPRRLLAYGLFFFPQTYMRTRTVLRELLPALPSASSPCRVLDLGTGSGAASFALADCCDRHLDVTAVDASTGALALMRELQQRAGEHFRGTLRTHAGSMDSLPVDGGPFDIILCSFALNELLETDDTPARLQQWINTCLGALNPGGLLVILEPALHTACDRLGTLRDTLGANGQIELLAPCLHDLPCPMREMDDVWCHDIRTWTLPDSVEYLNRHLHRGVQFLKYSLLCLRKHPPVARNADPSRCRLVGPITAQKGRYTVFGCAADGQIRTYELLARTLDKAAAKRLEELERGDCVRWEALKPLGDGKTWRATSVMEEGVVI